MKKPKKPLIDKNGEVRELTVADMKRFRPAVEADAAFVSRWKKTRGRPKGSSKTAVSIRLDDDVLAFFKSKGAGWQTRISAALRAIVEASI